MVASLSVGVSFAVNGQKHSLDPGLQPSTTLYDFLRGRTTYTVTITYPEAVPKSFRASTMPILHVSMGMPVVPSVMPVAPSVTLLAQNIYRLCDGFQGAKSGCGEGGCGSCSVEVYQYNPSSGNVRV